MTTRMMITYSDRTAHERVGLAEPHHETEEATRNRGAVSQVDHLTGAAREVDESVLNLAAAQRLVRTVESVGVKVINHQYLFLYQRKAEEDKHRIYIYIYYVTTICSKKVPKSSKVFVEALTVTHCFLVENVVFLSR